MQKKSFLSVGLLFAILNFSAGCPWIHGMPIYYIQPYSIASDCGEGVGGTFDIDLNPNWDGSIPLRIEFGSEHLKIDDVERRPSIERPYIVRVRVGQHICLVPLPGTVSDGSCYLNQDLQACKVRVAQLPWHGRSPEEEKADGFDPDSPFLQYGLPANELLGDSLEEARSRFEASRAEGSDVVP